jgi:hypothetical protein
MKRKPDKVVAVLIDDANKKFICDSWQVGVRHIDLKDLEGRPSEK